jgi:glucokinase
MQGDEGALDWFKIFGNHVGNMLKAVLHAYDPEIIFLGGSISKSFPLFKDSTYQSLETFMYKRTITNLKIEISEIKNAAVLGAASLALSKN